MSTGDPADGGPTWTFLTNHARVLRLLADNPQARISDIAHAIGITQRAVTGIISDLREAGYIEVPREGQPSQGRCSVRPAGVRSAWMLAETSLSGENANLIEVTS
ncbi:hypothetical protein BKM31_14915 [[Actinomadura] parvosata subsp. kistnae]|uniref:HTH marR-type domain-containing protein n=1 Tax=[Actinomadura] parvosata subsp. kistnae TaxID=1909395 RepID=A0A1U9ZXA7_9ACTN|nr:winged helix-turn-helix domain-containing protein [Nonomuraea sp. ATCC 55076]AQZ62578.1 hypothetical protein BKM31_14915 [Nonomuraea sp. ATCC 55076]